METDKLSMFIDRFEGLTKKPEKYISVQEDQAESTKLLTKELYNFAKQKESIKTKNAEVLDELVIANLDEEQIWQQIELQNNFIYDNLVSDVAHLLAKKDSLTFPLKEKEKKKPKINDEDVDESVHKEKSSKKGNKSKGKKTKKVKEPNHKSSVVDDKFFKLHEMEEFLEKMEKGEGKNHEDSDIDYFDGYLSDEDGDDDDDEKQWHYNDFFDNTEDENDSEVEGSENEIGSNDSVDEDDLNEMENTNDDNEDDDEEIENEDGEVDSDDDNEEIEEEDENGEMEDENENDEVKDEDENDESDDEGENKSRIKDSEHPSTFEARQERLKKRIKSLEEEALAEKPWQLKGEVTASTRPQNSLLEEYVEFDIATRPAPVLTEKSTLRLEDVIIQRIKDKAWDDVVRKFKPVENEIEYKKRLVLDQEKSKLSLAQIYEQEYLKQLDKKNEENGVEKAEVEPPEHQEIKKMMDSLFHKLDALSNFHFTPRQVKPEIKIVNNLPAISMEEVAPVAASDAALLAPEEVKPKAKGDLIGKSERTATDKKRERRQKKLKQKLKFKKMEAIAKMNLEKSNSKELSNKKISEKLLQKITKSSNITKLEESKGDKYIRSSNTFFSKLQSETDSKIKKKGIDLNKGKLGKVSAKKSKKR